MIAQSTLAEENNWSYVHSFFITLIIQFHCSLILWSTSLM